MRTTLPIKLLSKKISYYVMIYGAIVLTAFTTSLNAQTITVKYTTIYKAAQVNEFDNNNLTTTYNHKINIPNAEYMFVHSNNRSLYSLTSGPGFVKTMATNPKTGKSTPHTMDYPTAETFFKDIDMETFLLANTTSKGSKNHSGYLQRFKWKITSEKKTILKHLCKKAICRLNNITITAWYATDIKIKDGPARYWGLPGLILKISIGDYLETSATHIDVNKNNTEIIPPATNDKTKQ